MYPNINWVEVYPKNMSFSWSQLRKINFGDKGHNKNETLEIEVLRVLFICQPLGIKKKKKEEEVTN